MSGEGRIAGGARGVGSCRRECVGLVEGGPVIWRGARGSGSSVGVCSGEDSGEDATLLKPPKVEPEKWTRRGGRTSAVAGTLALAGGVGESDFGAGELTGVLIDGIDA